MEILNTRQVAWIVEYSVFAEGVVTESRHTRLADVQNIIKKFDDLFPGQNWEQYGKVEFSCIAPDLFRNSHEDHWHIANDQTSILCGCSVELGTLFSTHAANGWPGTIRRAGNATSYEISLSDICPVCAEKELKIFRREEKFVPPGYVYFFFSSPRVLGEETPASAIVLSDAQAKYVLGILLDTISNWDPYSGEFQYRISVPTWEKDPQFVKKIEELSRLFPNNDFRAILKAMC